jgi:hypothetical protein
MNATHFAAFSGCRDCVVTESASPLNMDARLPVGPIGVRAMPMSSFLPCSSVRAANVEIIHEPDRPITAIPVWISWVRRPTTPAAPAPPQHGRQARMAGAISGMVARSARTAARSGRG